MKVLNCGLMVNGNTNEGLERELSLISEYKSIPLRTAELDNKLIETAREFKPDLIFFQLQREGILKIDTFRALSEMGIKVINWTGDVRHPIPQFYFDYAPFCETSFSNFTDVLTMKEYGYKSRYLQIGYDDHVFFPKGVVRDIDIVFMGNNYGEHKFPLSKYRIDMVTRMKKEFGDRFKVYGNNWEWKDGSFNGNQKEENNLYNRTKIAINFSHFNYSRYSSDRMFRLTGSGTFCLSHDYEDVDMDWQVGEDIAVWKDIDELIEKCHYYLENEWDRIRIQENGFRRAKSRFTYKQMAENIIKL